MIAYLGHWHTLQRDWRKSNLVSCSKIGYPRVVGRASGVGDPVNDQNDLRSQAMQTKQSKSGRGGDTGT